MSGRKVALRRHECRRGTHECVRHKSTNGAFLVVAIVSLAGVDPATAGVVSGNILFTGNAVPSKKIDMDEDPQCNKLHSSAVLDQPVAVMDQKGCWFEPRAQVNREWNV